MHSEKAVIVGMMVAAVLSIIAATIFFGPAADHHVETVDGVIVHSVHWNPALSAVAAVLGVVAVAILAGTIVNIERSQRTAGV